MHERHPCFDEGVTVALIRDSLSRRLTASVTTPFSLLFFLQLMFVVDRFRERCGYHKANGEKREFVHEVGPYRARADNAPLII